MISQFDANLGGTEILQPLKNALKLDVGSKQKRVFLLTDGEVNDVRNREELVNFAKQNSGKMRIHTFGVGKEVD